METLILSSHQINVYLTCFASAFSRLSSCRPLGSPAEHVHRGPGNAAGTHRPSGMLYSTTWSTWHSTSLHNFDPMNWWIEQASGPKRDNPLENNASSAEVQTHGTASSLSLSMIITTSRSLAADCCDDVAFSAPWSKIKYYHKILPLLSQQIKSNYRCCWCW